MYKLIKKNGIDLAVILDGRVHIPIDEKNSDYQNYLQWLSIGNEPVIEVVESTPAIQKDLLDKASRGKKLKELSELVLNIIAGHNYDNGLDLAQILVLKENHPEALALLSDGQPYSAKPYLDLIVADEVTITTEEISHVMEAYTMFEENNPEFKA